MRIKAHLDHHKVSGLSGNEIYCLHKLGLKSGQLCIGNSVVAIGLTKGIGAGLQSLSGGEVEEVTQLVHDGRLRAFNRLMTEAREFGGMGISSVSFDVINHGGNLEFLAIGTTVKKEEEKKEELVFSTSANIQQLYCQYDAGFRPMHFVFGNVAYSIGVGGNIAGAFKSLKRGEVKEFTEIFDRTRHLALTRLKNEAKKVGANCVIGIETTLAPLMGAQEMLMIGTASNHTLLDDFKNNPVTSDMTNEELWNMVNIGYMPLQLVMGVSVYSLGFAGNVKSFFQTIGGGEVDGLTEVLYEAREKALSRIQEDAINCGADEVIGVKTRVYDLGGGMVEFMAIGTAVKKVKGAQTKHEQLPPQAIILDRDTFFEASLGDTNLREDNKMPNARRLQQGPMTVVIVIFVIIFYFIRFYLMTR